MGRWTMDYRKLAVEFFKDLHSLKKARPQKHISESLRGEAFAMQYIAYHDGPVLPGEISNEMGISSARIAAAWAGVCPVRVLAEK